MQKKPSNTREQCAFDRGAFKARMIDAHIIQRSAKTWADMRDERNPHKKGSVERQFWNDGFDSVSLK
jgi:hypothetical protein